MSPESRAPRVALYTFWGLALAAAPLTILIALFLTAYHCTDGDGGVPFVAGDSAQADVCRATGDGLVPAALALVLTILLAVFAFRRIGSWLRDAGGLAPAVVLTALLAASPLIVFGIYHLPSDNCTDEQEAAATYDCATY